MNLIESLNLRASAVRGRLIELERRMEQSADTGRVAKPALKELSTAIEVLQVANEQLSLHFNELASTRHETAALSARQDEFVNILPLPCIWTDERGTVEEANEATAALLNIATRRLAGKPLSLFLADRSAFLEALGVLQNGSSEIVDIAVQVRPRERRPRQMRATGHRLRHDRRFCWILNQADGTPSAPSEAN